MKYRFPVVFKPIACMLRANRDIGPGLSKHCRKPSHHSLPSKSKRFGPLPNWRSRSAKAVCNAASDMTARMSGGVPQADGTMKSEPTMDVQNVGNAVVHMASLPADANILFLNVMANEMPFVGRG